MKARIRWDVNHAGEDGKDLDFLIGLRKKGHKIPLLDKREMIPDSFLGVWQAFIRLSGARRGQGLPICIADILAYFEIVGIDHVESREIYMHAILELDQEISQAVSAKTRKPKESASDGTTKNR